MTSSPDSLEEICKRLLLKIGEDPQREGLLKTPKRFSAMFSEITSGYNQSLDAIVNGALFRSESSQMVIVRKVEFFSLCEHHLLPFYGHVHVGYLPDEKIIGLSKIPRIINMFARRLQVQERLTKEITYALEELLKPKGVCCVIEAVHLCAMMRGVQVQQSSMVTSMMRGDFDRNSQTRKEFLDLIKN